jgi:hypothetical protein
MKPARPTAPARPKRAVPVTVTLLTGVSMVINWVGKARCTGPGFDALGRSTPDYDVRRYRDICYSDIQHLWLGRGVNEHLFPFLHGDITPAGVLVGGTVEYPVLTGVLMWAAALFAHTDRAWLTDSALLLAPFGLAVGWMLARLAGWRALLWAAGSPLLLYAFHNWDLPAVACAVGAVAVLQLPGPPAGRAALVRRASWAAVLLGLGFAVKLYPGAFLLPLALYVLTGGPAGSVGREPGRGLDLVGALRVVAAGVGTAVVVNLPFAVLGFPGWRASFVFQRLRPVDLTTNSIWYWAFQPWSEPGNLAFQQVVGWVSPALVLASFALAAGLGWRGGRRSYRRTGTYPWVEVSAAMLTGFLLLHKVHSPQYALWLVPFFVLLRVRWGWVAGYLAADLALGLGIFRWFYELRAGPVAPVPDLAAQAVIVGVWGRAVLLVALFGVFLAADRTAASDSVPPGRPVAGRRLGADGSNGSAGSAPGEDRLLEVSHPSGPPA